MAAHEVLFCFSPSVRLVWLGLFVAHTSSDCRLVICSDGVAAWRKKRLGHTKREPSKLETIPSFTLPPKSKTMLMNTGSDTETGVAKRH